MNQNIALSNRRHIAFFGNTNAGKSALFNAVLSQDIAIVSSQKGTTTDPIIKAFELIPYGAVALIDTAGFGDLTALGSERLKKTNKIINRTDFAVFVADINDFDVNGFNDFKKIIGNYAVPYLLTFSKCDKCSEELIDDYKNKYPDAFFVSIFYEDSIENFKKKLSLELTNIGGEEQSMVGGLLKENSSVILVCPIDSAAPKGRLILPQVELLRDCLDNNIKCYVVKETELESAIGDLKSIDLVVTDSQAFKIVNEIVPENIPLTSFSLLMAKQKGDLSVYLKGADAISNLKENSKILIAEGCSHNLTHEDIGHFKIPKGLEKICGKNFQFDFVSGYDFPENVENYDLVIHCGGCMLTKTAVLRRTKQCLLQSTPITNYGVVLAYITGTLKRCRQLFD